MKKLFYSFMLFMSMTLVSGSFISCGEDDGPKDPTETDDDNDNDDGWIDCPECKDGTCVRCDGDGLWLGNGETCTKCDGSGWCRLCDGEGGWY